jgi:hypothetical protein
MPSSAPLPEAERENSPPFEAHKRGRPRGKPLSEAELEARRANLIFARAAPRDRIYRRTRRRREASRRNVQLALAWRRSPAGNARARLNALKHGLATKTSPELRAALGEAPEDFDRHLQLVARAFLPRDKEEGRLIERLAQATWRRMRIFRAQARLERLAWRRLAGPAGKVGPLTRAEVCQRADEVAKLMIEGRLVESEAWKLEDRIQRILATLVRQRAKQEESETRR